MGGLRGQRAGRVEHRARVVAALLDVGRERAAAERDAHLLGDGAQAMVEDLEGDGVERGRRRTAWPVTGDRWAGAAATRRAGERAGAWARWRASAPPHRCDSNIRSPVGVTRAIQPGGTTVVALNSVMTRGPRMGRLGGRAPRSQRWARSQRAFQRREWDRSCPTAPTRCGPPAPAPSLTLPRGQRWPRGREPGPQHRRSPQWVRWR